MEKASPAELRQGLDLADMLVKAGIRFVPMPVSNEGQYRQAMSELYARLSKIESMCDE